MGNKQVNLTNLARDLATTGQVFALKFIDGGGFYTVYVEDLAQPPTQPALQSQILATGIPITGGGGAGTPGGLDTQVQFNDVGAFGGDPTFTFDKATGILRVNGGPLAVNIGTTTPPTNFVVGDTVATVPRGIMSWQSSSDTSSARFQGRKSRGTFAAPTIVVTGDLLTRFVGSGYDGAAYLEMANITFGVTGTVALNRVPTQITFATATDAAPSVLTTALTIGADQSSAFAGNITVNGTIIQTSSAAAAFASGPNGNTNPVLRLVSNIASAVTGLSITGNASGAGVTLTALSSGANDGIKFVLLGTGVITVQGNTAATTARFKVLPSSGASFVQINDNGTMVIDSDVATGTNPLVIKYNGTTIASLGFSGTWSTVNLVTTSNNTGLTMGSAGDTGIFRSAAGVVNFNLGSGTAGTGWFIDGGIKRVSTQFDKTADTTLANVTGLSVTLIAGRTYSFEATLHVTADVVGGSKFAIGGTATATSIIYEIVMVDNTSNANTITSRQTALAGSSGQAGTTSGFCRIKGTITVNAAGTLTVQFAQNAAAGTSSVLVGSDLIVRDNP